MFFLKILHITTDNKFISHALTTFESVYPNQNTVWMLSELAEIPIADNNCYKYFSFSQTFSPIFLRSLENFDLVVLHTFIVSWYPLIFLAPKNTKFAWLGWGFDYYEYIYNNPKDLLLNKTLKLNDYCIQINKRKLSLKSLVKYPAKVLANRVIKIRALKRISSFSPVLKEDYDLIANAGLISSLPDFMPWNYGSLEENLIKNFIGQRVTGNSILVGNSASFTNNHIEAFDLLNDFNLQDGIEVITPLSYGDDCYKHEVIELGYELLGNSFQPITDFMPIDEYIDTIKRCGYVVMNHKRQQAVGNIVIMLYLGARVFLREENPTYKMLKSDGAILHTIQELESNPKLLKSRLGEHEIQKNIDILYKHWSKDAIDNKTKNLVEFHLGEAN